jgi:hypothetical protein
MQKISLKNGTKETDYEQQSDIMGYINFTLGNYLFYEKQDIKRYMPAALFTTVTSAIIYDIGSGLNLWDIKYNIYPFHHLLPLMFSFNPVSTLWLLKFFYKKFWIYSGIQFLLSIGFSFVLQPWLQKRGIWVNVEATSLTVLLINIPHFLIIYFYHMWQEGIYSRRM